MSSRFMISAAVLSATGLSLILCQGCKTNPCGNENVINGGGGAQADMRAFRYNEVQQISSHNSYDNAGNKCDLETQFKMGVRSFELDLHVSGQPGNWNIYHFCLPGHYVRDLRNALKRFRQTHLDNPNHEVVTIWLELKNRWESCGHQPEDLDACIKECLGEFTYTPKQLLSRDRQSQNLRTSIARVGWPHLNELRGKFLFVTMGNDDAGEQYLKKMGPNGVCFVAPENQLKSKLTAPSETWKNAVFFNCHISEDVEVTKDVYTNHLVSRIWRVDNQEEYESALGSMAHHIATDHVTCERFCPRLVDSSGQPFRPFPGPH